MMFRRSQKMAAIFSLMASLAWMTCVTSCNEQGLLFKLTDFRFFTEQPAWEISVTTRSIVDCAIVCAECFYCTGFAVSEISLTECHVIGPLNGTNCYSSTPLLDIKPFSPLDAHLYYSKNELSDSGPDCISCDSLTDPSCSETNAPSTTVPCVDGVCYTAKHNSTGVIRRGCRRNKELAAADMAHPESGMYICSSDPPGTKGTFICVCDGENCNAEAWSSMGGTVVEVFGDSYDQVYSCQCQMDGSPTVCFLDESVIIRGCSSNPCECIN